MCTILFQYKVNDQYPFVYLGNRDEFKSRPTRLAQINDGILMGQDLQAGGTWLAVRDNGRIAFITNYRDMTDEASYKTSRGDLVLNWVKGDMNIATYAQDLMVHRREYKGYNLVFGTLDQLHYYCNVHNHSQIVPPGLHGLSNGLLDEPWHKVHHGKEALAHLDYSRVHDAFHILSSQEVYTRDLPNTGLSEKDEIALSALFVDLDHYGTVVQQHMVFDGRAFDYYEKSIQDKFKEIRHLSMDMR